MRDAIQNQFCTIYLNTKYKQGQFINTVKSHESNKPNINLTIKTEAKVAEDLDQSNENSAIKKEGIQHTEARLEEPLSKNGKVMHGQYIRSKNSLLVKKTHSYVC
jgi:S-adenosylmethionine:tRNA-ribosyltransferase-isomerase (queuine synthetase)